MLRQHQLDSCNRTYCIAESDGHQWSSGIATAVVQSLVLRTFQGIEERYQVHRIAAGNGLNQRNGLAFSFVSRKSHRVS